MTKTPFLALVAVTVLAATGLLVGLDTKALLSAGPVALIAFGLGYLIDIVIFVAVVGFFARWRAKRRARAGSAGPVDGIGEEDRANRFMGFVR